MASTGSGAGRRKPGPALALPLVELSSVATGKQARGGPFFDLNLAIAEELGLEAVFGAQPRRRLEQVLQAGGADVLCFAHPARAAAPDKPAWSGLYLNETTELAAAAGMPIPAQLEDLPVGRMQCTVTHRLDLDDMLRQRPQARAALGQRRVLRVFDTRGALAPKSVVSLCAFDAALQGLRASGAHAALSKRQR